MKKKPKPEPRWRQYQDSGAPLRSVRISDNLWQAIQAAANAAGLTASEWLRQAAAEKMEGKR